jgi:hypothetical protein
LTYQQVQKPDCGIEVGLTMATTAARKGMSPGAALLVIGLLLALIAGGSHLAHEGSSGSSAAQGGGFHNPCEGKDPYHLLAQWTAGDGTQVRLRLAMAGRAGYGRGGSGLGRPAGSRSNG